MSIREFISNLMLRAASRAAVTWSPLPIRLIVGYGFMAHGFAKLSRGPEAFALILDTLGVPLPLLMSWATTVVELAGGAAVLLGIGIPLVAPPMAVVLLTALFTVHYRYGFFSVKLAHVGDDGVRFGTVGYEIILLYLAGLAALVIGGPGRLSLEAWIRRTGLSRGG
ncbi:MAG TPA: DoxX family protein [Pseudolabrys sp.]|nr:DoxX family protein [Pseudolabrys sp.]